MGWFSSKREIAELRKQVAQLAQLLNQHQPAGFDAGQILSIVMDGQVKQIGSTGEFIRMVHEIATERMANALGRKGGRRRAATATRDARGRMLPGPRRANFSDCRLCSDPTTADFTAAEFDEHQKHKGRQPREVVAERIEPTPQEREVIERADIDVTTSTAYPLPYVQHPMVPTPPGDDASGTSGDSQGQDAAHESHRNGVA